MKVHRHISACVTVLAFLAVSTTASAQTIGAPQVTVLPDNSVVLTYTAPGTPPADTILAVTYNGAPLANIPIGTSTTLRSNGPVPAGLYSVQVIWSATVRSDVVQFVVTGGGGGPTLPAPVMHPPVVMGNSVFLSWDAVSGAALYELEAIVFPSGLRYTLPVSATTLNIEGVPQGNYAVRVRARNAAGFSAFSNQVLAAVATSFRLRDLEISVTWNTEADIDLHVIEPDGTHVWWKNRTGATVVLDKDDTTGFGPEIASIGIGGSAPGIYQVFIVHFRGDVPTVSNVAITIGVGTANPVTRLITRSSEEAESDLGINAALVDVRSGVISEFTGTRPTAAAIGSEPLRKP